MNSFEFNKIFAAVLVAGIVAMLGGFVADLAVHPHMLDEDAVMIEGMEGSAGGGASGPTGPEPIMALIAAADVTKGEKLAKACLACHSFEQGGPDKVGPNLYAVVGGPTAHKAGFAYSAAMAEKHGQWDYDALNHFLFKPKDYIPGTKMNFVGLKKTDDRAALVAWLRQQGSSSYALPSDAQIAAEEAALAPPEAEAAEEGADASDTESAASEETPAAAEAEETAEPEQSAESADTAPSEEEAAE